MHSDDYLLFQKNRKTAFSSSSYFCCRFLTNTWGSDPVSSALISLMDLLASFARLIGSELPEGAAQDSQDLLDVFLGMSNTGREKWVAHAFGEKCALRQGNWKWVDGHLFDLSVDLGEQNDLAGKFPERARQMETRLKEIKETFILPRR